MCKDTLFCVFLGCSFYVRMKKADRDIKIMGIVNLTPDSYFAPSRVASIGAFLSRVQTLLDEGADIIDVGAVSTRPGAAQVSVEEEWRRLAPALDAFAKAFPGTAVSVDTSSAEIVSRCCEVLGRGIVVNDISAGEDDEGMLALVGSLGLRYIAMHKRGTPRSMQSLCDYGDVTEEVLRYFGDFARKAAAAGVEDWILDPGFGFAKSVEQNYELLRSLDHFEATGRELLIGISRKSFIYKPLGLGPEDVLAQTQALHLEALRLGADILRVHDVASACRTVKIYRMLWG